MYYFEFIYIYRLTDSTSTISSATEPKEPVKRAEPTEEAKIAGQAALARLEAKKNDRPRFNTYVIFKIIFIYYYTCLLYIIYYILYIIRLLHIIETIIKEDH